MFNIGARVYDEFNIDCTGEIIEVSHDSCYVKSVIDDNTYFVPKYRLWEVGTGPVMDEELEGYTYLNSI